MKEKDQDIWNVHEHKNELKVSCFNTIYHHEHGQLCIGTRIPYDFQEHYYLYIPITFKDASEAYKWINEGTIAELQEGTNNLNIRFTKENFIIKKRSF